MRQLRLSKKFKRDLKRCRRRGNDDSLLADVLDLLRNNSPLPDRCRPHKLVGEYTGYWECHIAPDWLLIYDLEEEGVLGLVRTGTHADLFR